MEPDKKTNGALVGLIVIIIILIVGGIYIWISNNNAGEDANVQTESVSTTDSAELNTLEQEINVTDIDVGANAINSVQ